MKAAYFHFFNASKILFTAFLIPLCVSKDLAEEVKELNKRISELERMLSYAMQPLRRIQDTTSSYLRIIQLLFEHGGLTPDLIIPEIKDTISREIIRVLIDRNEQNISQITELVRSKRGTASRRIIREKLNELVNKGVIDKHQKGALYVYCLSQKILKKTN
jgi:predicted transcriptional regulator